MIEIIVLFIIIIKFIIILFEIIGLALIFV